MEKDDGFSRTSRNSSSLTDNSNCISCSITSSSSGGIKQNNDVGINAQLHNVSAELYDDNNVTTKISRRPPSHPYSSYSEFAVSPTMMHVSRPEGLTHMRSLSQPSTDQLPSLSPTTLVSNERGTYVQGYVGIGGDESAVWDSSDQGLPLLPRGGLHRRSSSDVPNEFLTTNQPLQSQFVAAVRPAQLVMRREADCGHGLNDRVGEGSEASEKKREELDGDLISQYMNVDGTDVLNSSAIENKDSRAIGTTTYDSSENEGNSNGGPGASSNTSGEWRDIEKRSAPGDIAPGGRHLRCSSMESSMWNSCSNDDSMKLPPSPGFRFGQHSRSISLDRSNNRFEFKADEMKKIMENKKLAEIAKSDPKRARRILANRQSAARTKERKRKYVVDLETRVQTLQTEASNLATQLIVLERDAAGLTNLNNELKFRLQAMQQEAQLKNSMNEILVAEVQRLKIATGEISGEATGSSMPQQFMANNLAFPPQPSQYMYQLQQQSTARVSDAS